ncbi:hypothetical protein K504DRAFT_486372 [Pleomassaria siparia CBS 279.74]|uniref:Uncharacterized protein n=1 Tax=Pleomassaria siparia CBS 279.74 TaxID=1314801 RepID=A0A6G1KPQ7_9PLEO|nr:hypothetical protein K504DRAFT_486372 [Pleomassaria siparia CBS 279.74]
MENLVQSQQSSDESQVSGYQHQLQIRSLKQKQEAETLELLSKHHQQSNQLLYKSGRVEFVDLTGADDDEYKPLSLDNRAAKAKAGIQSHPTLPGRRTESQHSSQIRDFNTSQSVSRNTLSTRRRESGPNIETCPQEAAAPCTPARKKALQPDIPTESPPQRILDNSYHRSSILTSPVKVARDLRLRTLQQKREDGDFVRDIINNERSGSWAPELGNVFRAPHQEHERQTKVPGSLGSLKDIQQRTQATEINNAGRPSLPTPSPTPASSANPFKVSPKPLIHGERAPSTASNSSVFNQKIIVSPPRKRQRLESLSDDDPDFVPSDPSSPKDKGQDSVPVPTTVTYQDPRAKNRVGFKRPHTPPPNPVKDPSTPSGPRGKKGRFFNFDTGANTPKSPDSPSIHAAATRAARKPSTASNNFGKRQMLKPESVKRSGRAATNAKIKDYFAEEEAFEKEERARLADEKQRDTVSNQFENMILTADRDDPAGIRPMSKRARHAIKQNGQEAGIKPFCNGDLDISRFKAVDNIIILDPGREDQVMEDV